LKSGGLVGEVHPYVEKIALTKWLNREFGYQLRPSDLDEPKPILDEHELDWHLAYSNIFNDPEVRERARKHARHFKEKGIFSALYEFGSEE